MPPYTIQTEAGLSEDHGKWDSGTGEDNADDTAKLCHTKTGKCADGHKLMVIKVSLNPMMIR